MTARRAVAYMGLFLLLLGIYTVTGPPAEPVPGAAAPRAVFMDMAPDAVGEILLRWGQVKVRAVRAAGARWHAVTPVGARIPGDLLGTIVDTLMQAHDVEIAAERPADLAEFGLVRPRGEVTLVERSGATRHVFFGARNPARTAVYARRADQQKVVVLGLNLEYYLQLVAEGASQP